ncbi:hypothetical protein [Virgibacillus halodenitrificans]|uniref:hypothetical protein n=1 Tax=Virgibacillus halodenitrificans TaxID=1482 RepID=UPI0007614D4D
MKLYAQQGYGKGDKIHTGFDREFLDGVLLSPRDEKPAKMRSFIKEIQTEYPNAELLFDPQFYYSLYIDGTSKNLNNCSYYPGNIKLSSLRSFRKLHDFVFQSLEYQQKLGLGTLVSPNILVPNFSDRQAQIALSLAEESAIIAEDKGKALYVSLVFSESALNETRNVNDFLNELSTLDVTGYYITIDRKSSDYNQDFESETTLVNLLTFIYSLSEINEYKVIMGYSDIIGLLYVAVGASGFGTGWFNSSRKFTVQQRVLPSRGGRLPRERYTSIPLLNTVLASELDSIQTQFKRKGLNFDDILSNSGYEHIIKAGSSPSDTWSRGISHLQHWSSLKIASEAIFSNPDDISDRLDDLENHLNTAIVKYQLLSNLPIQLEKSSQGNHLFTWSNSLKRFRDLHHV